MGDIIFVFGLMREGGEEERKEKRTARLGSF
jgi:hypothetical protein